MNQFNINPSLGSAKLFRGKRRALSFQEDGLCLAIDVPLEGHGKIYDFFNSMDELVVNQGGIANIAKDSRLTGGVVEKMYPGSREFWAALHKWDPEIRFSHDLRCRIEPV